MNTVLKGDTFEVKVYEVIKDRLAKGELGFIPESCEIFHKKAYYSKDRMKDITFDISIETKFPGASKYSYLTLIECKSYNHSVPVNDVEEFYTKVNQVADLNGKGIFVTDSVFQEGAFNFANSKGITLIQLKNEDCNFILHRTNIDNQVSKDINVLITDLIVKIFEGKIEGLAFLSKKQIEEITTNFLNEVDNQIISCYRPTPVKLIEEFIFDNYKIKTVTNNQISPQKDKIFGYFNPKNKEIAINNTIIETPCFPFVFAHEVGHFKLHNALKINQQTNHIYNDPEINFLN
ncbi:MAG: restriction endonuclease [Bacteroidota bacterium]|nr:restriction endonuclease [Bacteroidota bacterium]